MCDFVNVYDIATESTYYAPSCKYYVCAIPPTTGTTLGTKNRYYIDSPFSDILVEKGWTLTTDLDEDGENALMLAKEPASCPYIVSCRPPRRDDTPIGIFSCGSGASFDHNDDGDPLLRDGADGDLASKKTV